MVKLNYSVTTEVSKFPHEVFDRIADLSMWWVEEFIGEELKPGSTFKLKVGDGHYSENKVIDFVPARKFAWVTTKSWRSSDLFDWTGTKMIFELWPRGEGTRIKFTYDGVVLEEETEKLKALCDYCIRELLHTYLESFTISIEVIKSPEECFKVLTEDVPKWWGGRDLRGRYSHLGDEFIVDHPGAHYSRQAVIEVVPARKIVWLVTEGVLHWLMGDKQEWTNTKMIFHLRSRDGKTILYFAHRGLVPSKECYEACAQGWTMVMTDWLYHYIMEGKVNERFL